MLHRILIISPAGLALYVKEFLVESAAGHHHHHHHGNSTANGSATPTHSNVNGGIKRGLNSYTSNATLGSTHPPPARSIALRTPNQLAGIIIAMLQFSSQRTGGLPVVYLQTTTTRLALATHAASGIVCAIFHDISDGQMVGQLVAEQLLHIFYTTYSKQLHQISSSIADQFIDFNTKITSIIQQCASPVLQQLQQHRGVLLVLLTSAQGDSIMTSTSNSSTNGTNTTALNGSKGTHSHRLTGVDKFQSILQHDHTPHKITHAQHYGGHTNGAGVIKANDIDQLSVLANHQALIAAASDLMITQGDRMQSVTLRSRRTALIVQRIGSSSLVVLIKNSVDPTTCFTAIDKSANVLRQLLTMAGNLKT